jgi:hypothetical protein
MKITVKILIFVIATAVLTSCGHSDLDVTAVPSGGGHQKQPSIEVLTKIPKAGEEYDVSSAFAFSDSRRIWSTGDWGAKTNSFLLSEDRGKTWKKVPLPIAYFGLGGGMSFEGSDGWAVRAEIFSALEIRATYGISCRCRPGLTLRVWVL